MDCDERLLKAELKIEQHDKMHEDTQSIIRALTDGINKLVQAEVRREQDEETFSRLFNEIKELREDLQSFKEMQATKELNLYKGMVWKSMGMISLVGASLLVGHYGTHLIG